VSPTEIKNKKRLLRILGGARLLPESLQAMDAEVVARFTPADRKPTFEESQLIVNAFGAPRMETPAEAAFNDAMERACETDWEGK
jgi:hypothetical protein